jgi:GxxExxY protein
MHTDDIDKIPESVIHCAIQVSNTLGVGFLEKVYENSLILEIKKSG